MKRESLIIEMPFAAHWLCGITVPFLRTVNLGWPTSVTPGSDCDQSVLTTRLVADGDLAGVRAGRERALIRIDLIYGREDVLLELRNRACCRSG